MRILLVTDNYAPATGGLERSVAALARELAERGHHVEVATMTRPDAPAVEREGPVTVRRLAGLTRHLQRFSSDPGHHFHPTVADPQLVARLQELVDETAPDVVHAHGWILHSCLALRLPPRTALVVTLHDYGLVCATKTMVHRGQLDARCPGPTPRRCVGCASAAYGPVKGVGLALGLVRPRLDRVSMFLPVSAAVAAAGLPDVDPARVTVVPSFVADDVATHLPPRPAFLPAGDVVLFVGALGEHKGVGLLATAHRRMTAAVPLVLIGSRRRDTPVLTGTAQRPVVVRTDVPHPQIMAAYAAAAVVAVPSRWPEPQGLVAVEAMAAGAAVVATRVGGLAELMETGDTGLLVAPGDADGLARALDDLVADPARRARMGAAARAASTAWTAGAVLPRVLDAYDRALGLAATRGAP